MVPIEEQSKKLCQEMNKIYKENPHYINQGYYMIGFS